MLDALRRRLFLGLNQLPTPLTTRLCGGSVVIDGVELDPHAQWFAKLAKAAGGPEYPKAHATQKVRDDVDAIAPVLAGPRDPRVQSVDETARVEGRAIPLRIYAPRRIGKRPAVVYFHGGGWVIGSLTSHDGVCRRIALDADCVVVAVDYRLAPEAPFPAAVEDARDAYLWVRAHAEQLSIDVDRIAVAGDSAGGNLAAVVSDLCRGESAPRYQLLLYPVTDLVTERPSYDAFKEGFYLSRDRMRWFKDLYAPEPEQRDDPRASPLLAEDLSGLPRTHLVTAGFDVLRDEGAAYAAALEAAGNEVHYQDFATLIHGFVNMGEVIPHAGRARDEILRELRHALHD